MDPRENQALMLMMELLGQDFSYSSIVSDLNEKGFRMRNDGKPWNRIAVFKMMPRLIEVGPRTVFDRRSGRAGRSDLCAAEGVAGFRRRCGSCSS